MLKAASLVMWRFDPFCLSRRGPTDNLSPHSSIPNDPASAMPATLRTLSSLASGPQPHSRTLCLSISSLYFILLVRGHYEQAIEPR